MPSVVRHGNRIVVHCRDSLVARVTTPFNRRKARNPEVGFVISARRVTWLSIHLLILLAAATATLAILLSGDPAGRPLWLILLVAAIAVCCLLLIYVLGTAIVRPVPPSTSLRQPVQPPRSPQSPPP